uniref:Gluconokinase n=1 Tax=Syphacia muris TaxID=451379 RepID=A0A0N5AVQ3_9BILA
MVPDCIFVVGVAGCGKTTIGRLLSEKIDAKFVDADDYHSCENRQKMRNGIPLTDSDRYPWLEKLAEIVAESSHPLVLACSALKPEYRKILSSKLPSTDAFIYLHLKVKRSELEKRLKERKGHFVDERLLDSQLNTLSFELDEINVCPVDANGSIEQTVSSALVALGC